MKQLLFILFLVNLSLLIPAKAYSDFKQIVNENNEIDSKNFLFEIQDKIDEAFLLALKTKQAEPLVLLEENLNKLKDENSSGIIVYWQSYAKYFLSICYLQLDNTTAAKETINKAIDLIEGLKTKNSEDYTLLAYEQSFSCQFKPGIIIPLISKKLKSNCETALKIDSLNMRAYFVLGSNDFYTPEMFGGGKSAEKMLLKAISLPNQKIANPFLPSWGKENAYELLIRWYIRKEKWDLAQKYYNEGLKKYPSNFMIQELASKLKK